MLERSNSLTAQLVVPPVDGQPGTCWRCRQWTDAFSEDECSNCARIAAALGSGAVPLDLISLYCKPSQLRDWLTRYKGRIDGSEPRIPRYDEIVKALLARFFYEHGDQIISWAPIDCIVLVPSTDRPAPHPLHAILADLNFQVPIRTLLCRGSGDLGFHKPARDGYTIAERCSPQRILLVDDVYTTGARIKSAAVALVDAGHELSGTFVIARRVNPSYQPANSSFWADQTSQRFDWQQSPVVNRRR